MQYSKVCIYTKSGEVLSFDDVSWSKFNKDDVIYHREDGPAFIKYGEYNTLEVQCYYINDLLHGEGFPAYTEYYPGTCRVKTKVYFSHGKRHRLDGPAVINYCDFGCIQNLQWFIDDKEYSKEKFEKIIQEVNDLSHLKRKKDVRWWVREL